MDNLFNNYIYLLLDRQIEVAMSYHPILKKALDDAGKFAHGHIHESGKVYSIGYFYTTLFMVDYEIIVNEISAPHVLDLSYVMFCEGFGDKDHELLAPIKKFFGELYE